MGVCVFAAHFRWVFPCLILLSTPAPSCLQTIPPSNSLKSHVFPLAARALSQVIEANGAPCVIHCAAGKDRTGVAMAFILLACGVGVKEVLDDYELSNVHNAFRCAQVRPPALCYFL